MTGVQRYPTPVPSGGDVDGPASATDNALARYDGTTGKLLQDSSVSVTDAGKLQLIASGSASAGINIAPGSAPSSPVNGDIWTTTSGVYARINGVTQGPFESAAGSYQPASGDLTAIDALAGTSGFLKKTGTDTWTLDTNTYITGNQTITLSGDASGSGTTAITVTVADDSHSHTGATISGLDAADTTTGTFDIARIPTGSTGTTVALGNHTHSYLSSSTSSTQDGYFGDIYLYDDSTPSHYLRITNSANLTLARVLNINVNDADRTVSLSGNLTVPSAATVSGTNTGDQTITLTGNVTGSGTGSFAATIANDAVTYAKMQNVSAQYRVLGRITAAAGDVEELTGENLVTVLGQATSKTGSGSIVFHTAPTFSGTVTATTFSGSGASLTSIPQSAVTNLTTDLSGKQPLDADLTAIAALAGTSGLLKKTAADTWTLDTTAYTTNTGTVTSVGMTVPTGLSISGSPITTSGTLALTLTAGYEIPTTAALAAKAPLASPTFTGTVTANTIVPSSGYLGLNYGGGGYDAVRSGQLQVLRDGVGDWNTLFAAYGTAAEVAADTPRFAVWGIGAFEATYEGKIKGSGNVYLRLNGGAGYERQIHFQSNGSKRWSFGAAPNTETGSNAGSTFTIARYSDLDAWIDNPLEIDRATGTVYANDGMAAAAPGTFNSFVAGSTSNVGAGILDGSFVANRDSHAIMYLLAQGSSGIAARIRGWVAGGTAASKTVPTASSLLLSIDARGWGGTGYRGGSGIEFSLGTGTFSDTSMPGKIEFQTVPDGSVTRQTRLTIDQNGLATFTGKITTASPTTSIASLNLPHGSAPTSPANGDVWSSTSGVYARVNSETKLMTDNSGYKNRMINGSFEINQRGATSTTADLSYVFDRWFLNRSGGTATYSSQTGTIGNLTDNFVTHARIVTASQSAAGDFALLAQALDGVHNLAGKTVTVSFWAKAGSGTPKIAVEWSQVFGTGGSAAVNTYGGQVTLSTSWVRYSVTMSIPSVTSKTLGSTVHYGQLNLWTSAGTTYSSRTGTLGVQNTTIDIWGVQVEDNPIATSYEYRPAAIELLLCQRYYYRINSSEGGLYTNFVYTRQDTATVAYGVIHLPVKMRRNQTLENSALSTFLYNEGTGAVQPSGLAIDMANQMSPSISVTYATGGRTVGRAGTLYANNTSSAYIALNAEVI